MKFKIYKEIPFKIDVTKLNEDLKISKRLKIDDLISELINESEKIARPKGIYTEVQCKVNKEQGEIYILDKVFKSKILASSIKNEAEVFPYIITCGMEIEKWSQDMDDIMKQYVVDGIKAQILFEATEFISRKIKESKNIKELTYHIPGYLDDWSLYEQSDLFALFGEKPEDIEVSLSHSSLMKPTKSVSGIYY